MIFASRSSQVFALVHLIGACLATGNRIFATGSHSVSKIVLRFLWPFSQWNPPKYDCQGTVTTRFALIALIAWQY